MWIQRIQKSFKKLFTVPSQPLTGFLGNRSGVVATGTTGFVYVTLLSSGQTVVARNTVVPMIPGLPVNVIRDPSNTYRVESVIDLHENLPYPEQSQPDTTPMTWPGASTVWIRDAQILDGLPIPIPNTLSVQVYGRWYFLENLFHVIDHTIVDLTSELPASGAEWVNVEIDSAGVVSFLHGTNVDTWEILTPEDVPISDSTKYFLFSVRMYVGQTQIRKVDGPDCDLFDPRFTRIGSGGGGTPVGGDTEIQFNDAGIFGSDTEFIFDKTTKTVRVGPYDRGIRLFGGAGDISQYAPDGENPVLDQHAWDGIPGIIPQVSEGTLASQAAISLGKVLWHVAVKAFNGTDFKDAGRIRAVATENHDGTSSGVKWEVYCVENTTNTEVLVATFDQDGNVNIASGKQYQVNGAQHTHPELDLATVIHAATEETSLHVDDEVGIWEHVSGLLRRVKFSTWISGLGAYFVPHSSATASNDFLVGVGTGAWIKKTLAETATILRTALDSVYAAISHTHAAGDVSGIREVLVANRTYYVRTDGSDSNNGLANTSGGAFLTIQKAMNVIKATLDLAGYNITIQVGDGTYTSTVAVTPWVGGGQITIQGNSSTPANVLISTTSVDGFSVSGVLPGILVIRDLKIVNATSGSNIGHYGYGQVNILNINFGAGSTAHISVLGKGAYINVAGNYAISGGAPGHWACDMGTIRCNGWTVTITGTPAFTYFARCVDGMIKAISNTFSGSATGTRYYVNLNGVIDTNGGGATYLPGNVGGSTATGGQYG